MTYTRSNQQSTKKRLRVLMVTGIYPTEKNPHAGTFIKSLVDSLIAANVEVEVVHPKPGPVLLRYISAAVQVFLKTLTGNYDIVHGHYCQWCLLARLQWTTPVLASFLGSDLLGDVTFDGHLTKKGLIITHISRWLCWQVDAVTVKTEEMKKVAGSHAIVYSDGVDFELFRPIPRAEARAALGWDQHRFYVLFGNNPGRQVKNFPLARAAIECLQARGVTAELVVASGLPQKTLVQYINASNAVILSSISEGSPNIVKEAMACNVPVVATNVGDVQQLIGHTQGCSVCPHDPESLAAGLEQALQHTEPTTGRSDIMHLERSVVAKQVIAVYEQVISKKDKRERKHSLLKKGNWLWQ
jgi:teichuronic acid biosynthesis glycosyltransferase TuaC